MNINLHNYEEFFLLYADNELSQQKRMVVEQFIRENPELEEEFDMINMTVVKPDETFQIMDKTFLLKSTGTELIHEKNYDEIFVLFHDGELTEEQKGQTNDFLETHAELKDEFLLIGQAKMEGDPISFPDKKSLLRKEHSGITGRIILFRSLAAAVLGFGLWIAIPYLNGDTIHPQVAQQPNVPDTNITLQNLTEKIPGQSGKAEIAIIENKTSKTEGLAENKKSDEKITGEKSSEVFPKNEKQILAKHEIKQSNSIQPEKRIENTKENYKREEGSKGMIAQIPLKKISTGDIFHSNELIAHVDLDITPQVIEKGTSAQNVVYLDVNKESSDNYIFYNVPADEFKKSKVGGFLKKLKRVAERNDPIKRLFEMGDGQVASNH